MTNTLTHFQYDLHSSHSTVTVIIYAYIQITQRGSLRKRTLQFVCTSTDLEQQRGCNIDKANDANNTYYEGMKL